MGSDESTSRFEVTKSKSRKHERKKMKSTDAEDKFHSDKDPLENNEKLRKQDVVQKNQRGKKRKVNNTSKPSIITDKKAKSKSEKIDRNEINKQTENEATLSKKLKKSSIMHTKSNGTTENIDELEKGNTKVSKPVSKRQQKRENIEKRETQKREASRLEATQKALNYVSMWKHARSEWKFEKLRQIWLMDNLLDNNSIPDNIFSTVLEYFEGCKGMAREQLLKTGMDVIRKAEEDEENRDEIMESVAYKRARQLLQALPIET